MAPPGAGGATMPMMNVSNSHSGHSGSNRSGSGHSHPSHHSSTGPSNNTTATTLTGNSQQSANYNGQYPGPHFQQQQQQQQGVPYSGGGAPPGFVPMAYAPPLLQEMPPPHPYAQPAGHHPHYPNANPMSNHGVNPNPGLYRKPSPPGSIASHKSSSLHSSASPASSVSNYKPRQMVVPPAANRNAIPQYAHSPTTQQNNIINNLTYSKAQPNCKDLYIPETCDA